MSGSNNYGLFSPEEKKVLLYNHQSQGILDASTHASASHAPPHGTMSVGGTSIVLYLDPSRESEPMKFTMDQLMQCFNCHDEITIGALFATDPYFKEHTSSYFCERSEQEKREGLKNKKFRCSRCYNLGIGGGGEIITKTPLEVKTYLDYVEEGHYYNPYFTTLEGVQQYPEQYPVEQYGVGLSGNVIQQYETGGQQYELGGQQEWSSGFEQSQWTSSGSFTSAGSFGTAAGGFGPQDQYSWNDPLANIPNYPSGVSSVGTAERGVVVHVGGAHAAALASVHNTPDLYLSPTKASLHSTPPGGHAGARAVGLSINATQQHSLASHVAHSVGTNSNLVHDGASHHHLGAEKGYYSGEKGYSERGYSVGGEKGYYAAEKGYHGKWGYAAATPQSAEERGAVQHYGVTAEKSGVAEKVYSIAMGQKGAKKGAQAAEYTAYNIKDHPHESIAKASRKGYEQAENGCGKGSVEMGTKCHDYMTSRIPTRNGNQHGYNSHFACIKNSNIKKDNHSNQKGEYNNHNNTGSGCGWNNNMHLQSLQSSMKGGKSNYCYSGVRSHNNVWNPNVKNGWQSGDWGSGGSVHNRNCGGNHNGNCDGKWWWNYPYSPVYNVHAIWRTNPSENLKTACGSMKVGDTFTPGCSEESQNAILAVAQKRIYNQIVANANCLLADEDGVSRGSQETHCINPICRGVLPHYSSGIWSCFCTRCLNFFVKKTMESKEAKGEVCGQTDEIQSTHDHWWCIYNEIKERIPSFPDPVKTLQKALEDLSFIEIGIAQAAAAGEDDANNDDKKMSEDNAVEILRECFPFLFNVPKRPLVKRMSDVSDQDGIKKCAELEEGINNGLTVTILPESNGGCSPKYQKDCPPLECVHDEDLLGGTSPKRGKYPKKSFNVDDIITFTDDNLNFSTVAASVSTDEKINDVLQVGIKDEKIESSGLNCSKLTAEVSTTDVENTDDEQTDMEKQVQKDTQSNVDNCRCATNVDNGRSCGAKVDQIRHCIGTITWIGEYLMEVQIVIETDERYDTSIQILKRPPLPMTTALALRIQDYHTLGDKVCCDLIPYDSQNQHIVPMILKITHARSSAPPIEAVYSGNFALRARRYYK